MFECFYNLLDYTSFNGGYKTNLFLKPVTENPVKKNLYPPCVIHLFFKLTII
jgi:hypothetical protein